MLPEAQLVHSSRLYIWYCMLNIRCSRTHTTPHFSMLATYSFFRIQRSTAENSEHKFSCIYILDPAPAPSRYPHLDNSGTTIHCITLRCISRPLTKQETDWTNGRYVTATADHIYYPHPELLRFLVLLIAHCTTMATTATSIPERDEIPFSHILCRTLQKHALMRVRFIHTVQDE